MNTRLGYGDMTTCIMENRPNREMGDRYPVDGSNGSRAGTKVGTRNRSNAIESPKSIARGEAQFGSSLNPRPAMIIGTHFSARATRVFACFALEIWKM